RRRETGLPVRIPLRDLLGSGIAIAGLWSFASVDMLLARYSLTAVASGNYIAANNAARSLLVIPQAVLLVALPRLISRRRGGHRAERGPIIGALVLVGAITAAAGSLVVAFRGLVLRTLYGSAFAGAVPLLKTLVAATFATALLTVITHSEIARRSSRAYLVWAGVALEAGLILRFHQSARQIAGMAL